MDRALVPISAVARKGALSVPRCYTRELVQGVVGVAVNVGKASTCVGPSGPDPA